MENPNPVANNPEDYSVTSTNRQEDYSNSTVQSNPKFNIDNLNKRRNELVAKVLEASDVYNNILLEFATGTGKSNCAIQVIKRHYPSTPKILILIAEISHRNNWKREFKKFGVAHYLDNCTIECYQSAHKYINDSYDIIIADEAHHLLETELRLNIAMQLKASRMLFLSATLKRTQKNTLRTIHKAHLMKVNLSKAVEHALLPEFKMVALTLELDRVKKNHVVVVNKKLIKLKEGEQIDENIETLKTVNFNDRFLPHHKGTPYKMILTDWEYYLYLRSISEMFRKKSIRNPNKYMDIYLKKRNEIKKYLGNLKTEYAKELSQKLYNDNQRFICYCTSINQANKLSTDSAVHSNKSEKVNNQIIDSFQKGDTNSIYAVSKLVEGVNLDNIDAGIIIQMDNTERLFVQKSGRIMRSVAPVCYILYFKNTIDVDYVTNSLSNIDAKFKVKHNFNEFIKW